MNFYDAMTTGDSRTQNYAVTNSTSGSALVDFFFSVGALRKANDQEIVSRFARAYGEDKLLALKILFYGRDIRGGQGERRLFRVILRWLADMDRDVVLANLHLVPHYGRWDDLFVLVDTDLKYDVYDLFGGGIANGDGLVGKWMPREGGANDAIAKDMASYWGMSMREYRQMIVDLSTTVEQLMSSNQWSEIEYQHVPSVAMMKYRKAFARHNPTRWANYMEQLESGKAKVNAAVLYPSDIVGKILNGQRDEIFNHQWNALPNYVSNGDFIPVCDVSGSMSGKPMEVSIGLGLYLSERNTSDAFRDLIITFSAQPKFHKIQGDGIVGRVANLSRANWDMNTNLEAVFRLILRQAMTFDLPNDEMPKNILIISDMEFDQCVYGGNDQSLYNGAEQMYRDYGYTMPSIVFWNVDAKSSNYPVKYNQNGVALVSGYSPSIMKTVLGAEFNPYSIMINTIESERYSPVSL